MPGFVSFLCCCCTALLSGSPGNGIVSLLILCFHYKNHYHHQQRLVVGPSVSYGVLFESANCLELRSFPSFFSSRSTHLLLLLWERWLVFKTCLRGRVVPLQPTCAGCYTFSALFTLAWILAFSLWEKPVSSVHGIIACRGCNIIVIILLLLLLRWEDLKSAVILNCAN